MTANKPTVKQSIKKVKDLEKSLTYADAIVSTVREPLLVLYPSLKIKSASKSFYKTFKVQRKDAEGKLIFELGNGQWDIPILKRLLNGILETKTIINDFEVEHRF